ncbi:hypothetical protein pb186bvf_010914 [Paramecium bursaria]
MDQHIKQLQAITYDHSQHIYIKTYKNYQYQNLKYINSKKNIIYILKNILGLR